MTNAGLKTLGIMLAVVGTLLTLTFIGAIVGLPMLAVGIYLYYKAI